MSKPKSDIKKKVLIVDDHPILRKGIGQLIEQEGDLTVCGEAEDAYTALKVLQEQQPDIAVVDITLKDSSGIELIKDMSIRFPKIPVLVLSMHDESFYAERVLRAGASGYVTKGESSAKVIEGIRKVLAGEVYVSEKLAAKMIGRLVGSKREIQETSVDSLSDREFQVFQLVGQGMQSSEIAEKLHLSVKTIDTHRENIKRKLKLKNATELLQRAIQWVTYESGGSR